MHPLACVPVAALESHRHNVAPAPAGFPRADGPTRFPMPRKEREIIYKKKLLDPAIDLHPDVSATLVVSMHGAAHACHKEGSPASCFHLYPYCHPPPQSPPHPQAACAQGCLKIMTKARYAAWRTGQEAVV